MPIASERDVLRSEFRWGLLTAAAVGLIFLAILTAALAWQINPPSNVELIDPKTLHLSGEFTEDNLGTQIQGDTVAIRMIASQFAFLPRCVVAPRGRAVTLRLVSPGCHSRHFGYGNECKHHGRARLRQPSTHDLHSHGRPPDAVS